MIQTSLLAATALLPLALAALPARAQISDDSTRAMLLLARSAVDRGLVAEGREALERAETRLLNAGPVQAAVSTPSASAKSSRPG